jgi:hypothetical protein
VLDFGDRLVENLEAYENKCPWQTKIIPGEFAQEIEHYARYYKGGKELHAPDDVEWETRIVRWFDAISAERHAWKFVGAI